MSRTEPGLEWTHQPSLEATLAALRKTRIGPLFPADPDHRPGMQGTRQENRGGKDTKAPYRRRGRVRSRKSPDNVTARCLSCGWTASGRTWRPGRRRLAEHVGKKHSKLASAGVSHPGATCRGGTTDQVVRHLRKVPGTIYVPLDGRERP